jgi:RNA polymerase sigma-70 factor (ECF subfamily)
MRIEKPTSASEAGRAATFEEHRGLLRGLAYRMLGSMADADDVVQETFLRWRAADVEAIMSPRAWLVTACTRLAIDELRTARRSRVAYVGPWLPEPVIGERAPGAAELAELGESLTFAFLLLLERLGPAERAALLLHEVLDLPHAEIARVLGRTEPACRQLLTRARRRLAGSTHPPMPLRSGQGARAEAFFTALHAADVPALMAVLTEDAQAWSDGGGKVTAARRVIRGAGRVARFLAGIVRKAALDLHLAPATVNGRPGRLLLRAETVVAALSIEFDAAGRIAQVFIVRNPDKLSAARAAGPAQRSVRR